MSDDLVTLVAVCEKAAKSKFSVTIDPVAVLPVVRTAATALTEARAEIEEVRRTAKHLLIAANIYQDRADAAESELATLRDMLTLCGELGGIQTGETMADYLRRLIDEVAGKETERELAKSAAITAYLAQREKEGWVMVPKVATEAMLKAGHAGEYDRPIGRYANIYRAMLAAAQNGGE